MRRERKRPAADCRALWNLDTCGDADTPLYRDENISQIICPAHDPMRPQNDLPFHCQSNDHWLHPPFSRMKKGAPENLSPVIDRHSSLHQDPMRNSSWFLSWIRKIKQRNQTTRTGRTLAVRRNNHHQHLLYILWVVQMLGALADNEDNHQNNDNNNDNAKQEDEDNNDKNEEDRDDNAEGEEGEDGDVDQEIENNGNYIPYSTGQHWSYSHSINPYGYLDVHDTCLNQPQVNKHGIIISISSIHLVCDSPGAYYQGSNTYRNSATCMTGDTAKLTIDCKCTLFVCWPFQRKLLLTLHSLTHLLGWSVLRFSNCLGRNKQRIQSKQL